MLSFVKYLISFCTIKRVNQKNRGLSNEFFQLMVCRIVYKLHGVKS